MIMAQTQFLAWVFKFSEDNFTTIKHTPFLTHLSLASLLWDIGKQNSPRCDATERGGVPSGAILFAQRNFIKNEIKIKNHS